MTDSIHNVPREAAESPESPVSGRPDAAPGLTCTVLAGHHEELYHQIALRLALEGHRVVGAASAAANRRLAREVDDFAGRFEAVSLAEAAVSHALVVLVTGPWSRRVVVSCAARPSPAPPGAHEASPLTLLTYDAALEEEVIGDLADVVVAVVRDQAPPTRVHLADLDAATYQRREERPGAPPPSSVPVQAVQALHTVQALQTVQPRRAVRLGFTPLGRGVFATRAFMAGELVLETRGVRVPRQTEHSLQIEMDVHIEPSYPARMLNHACEPNLGVRTNARGLPDFYALRPIAAGEALAFDYAMTEWRHEPRDEPHREFSLVCRCGAPSCRGKLGYYSELPPAIRAAYGEFVSAYLLRLDFSPDASPGGERP